jgi:uncharacterized protein (DUF1697 family)
MGGEQMAATASGNKMIRYVAFLRAINVGGQRLIKMEELARIFTAAGLKNVRTYIQSGNVLFDSASANAAGLRKKIEKALRSVFGYEVPVMIRRLADIEEMVRRNPFQKIEPGADVMLFVVFLSDEPRHDPELPLMSAIENIEVFEVKERAAFILSHRKKNGMFGFPNKFVEKTLGVSGTTRNWSTVNKILKVAEKI